MTEGAGDHPHPNPLPQGRGGTGQAQALERGYNVGEMKKVAHILLFILAFAAFYFGLGVGLAYDATLGSILWLVAAGIVVGNILWIVRTKK